MRALVLTLGAALLSACSLLQSDEPDAPTSASLVVTDRAKYEARLVSDGRDAIVFEVPFEIRNTTGGPLYRVGCRRPPKPVLEKLEGGQWVTAYSTGELLCLSPPFVVASGETGRDTLQVYGHLSGQDTLPEFRTEVEGTYRLQLELYSSLTNEQAPLGEALVPLADRVSNTFEVE
ncbi:hypothetical protein [Rubrivirga marina]|uniref:Lipoprotein n=1 Tax=Rubrivirga marina TaxID=1196024 RepID=A0A271J2Y4_9BACT|nr:hypothetical protein [Rubrivirga marina]PAP77876.1 hypothetical protein BSZ37_16225 [Rubrivirga marina]